jgi:NADPH:quinone reductase
MRRIVHHELGEPAQVLRVEDRPSASLGPPRSLTLKGVVLGSWMEQPPEQREADVALAQRLACAPGTLFEVAGRYAPSRIADAIRHVSQAGRTGVVLIDFLKDVGAGS